MAVAVSKTVEYFFDSIHDLATIGIERIKDARFVGPSRSFTTLALKTTQCVTEFLWVLD